jgi:hypothetical protein
MQDNQDIETITDEVQSRREYKKESSAGSMDVCVCVNRIIVGIKWPKVTTNTELWGATGEKPIILQSEMRKWRWIGHTLRKGNKSTEEEALDWNQQLTRGVEDRSKPGNRPFWWKQEKVAKHRARLRGWLATELDGYEAQMSSVPNVTERYTTTMTNTTTTATTNCAASR